MYNLVTCERTAARPPTHTHTHTHTHTSARALRFDTPNNRKWWYARGETLRF